MLLEVAPELIWPVALNAPVTAAPAVSIKTRSVGVPLDSVKKRCAAFDALVERGI